MAFNRKNPAKEQELIYEGAHIYWRTILYDRQVEIERACTDRGELDAAKVRSVAAKESVVRWEPTEVLDDDDQPTPVPEDPQERAAVVATFPNLLIMRLGVLAFADNPELIKKNWQALSLESFDSPTGSPGESSPASTADATTQTRDNDPLATEQAA